MPEDRTFYIGLASTFHDPAIAILDPEGRCVFAEATERYLQYKRAFNCQPDPTPRMGTLLGEFVDADAFVVVSSSWGERFVGSMSDRASSGQFDLARISGISPELNSSGVSKQTDRAYLASLSHQQAMVGVGTAVGLSKLGGAQRIADVRRYPHHLCHAAAATLASPFDAGSCLVVDGMGERGAVAVYRFDRSGLHVVNDSVTGFSPGFFFGLLTDLCGFDQTAGEEWKMMGLAPYGSPDAHLTALASGLFEVEDGLPVPTSAAQVRNVVRDLERLRPVDSTEGWADLARAAQDTFATIMDLLVEHALAGCDSGRLVLTGGCALNSSYNGQLISRTAATELFVPPAPADDGNALGAAALAWADDHPRTRPSFANGVFDPYLGTRPSTRVLEQMSAHEPRLRRLPREDLAAFGADVLASGRMLGWMQGPAEYGPRALGNRSILADPRPADAKAVINAKIKYRESFRPFAPSLLSEHASDWFEDFQDSPYMERTLRWRPGAEQHVPAVVHEDSTGRLQVVHRSLNPTYHDLITAFYDRTGVPVLLNTSLNVMGRPICHTAEDALLLFFTTGLDALVIEDWVIEK